MKGFLILLLAATALCMPRDVMSEEDSLPFGDFVKGFLEGIKENTDPEKLMKCINEGEEILKKIVEALKLIKTMIPTRVIEGVKMLIEALRQLFNMLKPCTEGYEQLKKLIQALDHVSIPAIVKRILAHPGEFAKHITEVIEGIIKKDHYLAGKAFGEILYMIFLAKAQLSDTPFVEFVKGFLEGIKEKTDPEKLMKCLHEGEAIIKKIVDALKLIKTMIPTKVLEGVKLLIEALRELFNMLKPCTEGYEQLKKLVQALDHISIPSIVKHILAHPGEFAKYITEVIEGIIKKNHNEAGKAFGQILYMIFLTKRAQTDPHFIDFIKGFLEGIKETTDPEKILKCVEQGDELLKKIVEALKMIKTMIPTKVIEGVKLLIEALRELF